MTTHELKCWPVYFEAIMSGTKTFEVRKDDRGFRVGDHLLLREWDWDGMGGEYTGRTRRVEVTYLMRGPQMGIEEAHVVMAISKRLEEPS